jgi:hypothetical protein
MSHIMTIRNAALLVALSLPCTAAPTCGSAPANPDAEIEGMEVTQGIQDQADRVPLLAGKRTFVRVYVRGLGDDVPAVGARLDVVETSRTYAPINRTSIVPPVDGSHRDSLDDSFLFELAPEDTAAGARTLQASLVLPPDRADDGDALLIQRAQFGPAGDPIRLRLYGVRYGYHDVPESYQRRLGLASSTWPAPSRDLFEPQRAGAENMLPIASLAIAELPGDPVGDFACRYLGSETEGGCDGYQDARPWAEDLIDQQSPGGGAIIVILQPEQQGGHLGAWFMTDRGNHVINFQADTVDVGSTLAHELGHAFGLSHTFEDPRYPRADGGLGPFIGLRGTPTPSLVLGVDARGQTLAYDLMSYAFNSWISPYSYCRALQATAQGRWSCPTSVDHWNDP